LDKMIDKGMINELSDFYQKYGTDVSVEKGICQAIGYREFIDYHNSSEVKDFENGKQAMFFKTRRYGVQQIKRLNNALLSQCKNSECDPGLIYGLDSSRGGEFFEEDIINPSIDITENFLANYNSMNFKTYETDFCQFKNNVLVKSKFKPSTELLKKIYTCDICNISVKGESELRKHLASKKHRKIKSSLAKKSCPKLLIRV